jgi:hypothetical protein
MVANAMSGRWSPRLSDLLPLQEILIRIDSLFKLREAPGHILEPVGVCGMRRRQNRRPTRGGLVSAKEKDRKPHGARNETGTKRPEEYLQRHGST